MPQQHQIILSYALNSRFQRVLLPKLWNHNPKNQHETRRPTENPEETKRRELFYSEEKKKESYTKIESLLSKYEEGQ